MRQALAAWVVSLAVAAPYPAAATTTPTPSRSFQTVLEAHLRAVSARNLQALEQTLTRGAKLDVYLPDGRRLTTKAEFVDFHRQWFEQRGWTMRFEPVDRLVGADLAVATVRTRYEDVVDGKPYFSENWLSLTFRKEGSEWRFVEDQNTRIRSSAAK